ncbi:hypothetical protein A1F94_013658 [Pyrenophora tritici-repentis]|nr:hypothetical protein A1F94_013658 [Pyrenophora tritici-repentis]
MSKPSIECQYFEHVPEHSVAACRECRYAVWPDQIEGHLQKQHKVSYKEAEAVGQQVRSWAGLVQYPSELEVPTGAPKPVRQLPVYTDGMLCQFDSSCCYYVARSKEAIRKRKDHQGWSAGKKRGRPSRTRQKSVQAHMDKGTGWSIASDYSAAGMDRTWARVGEQMAKAWADIEKRAQTTIQEGERDEVNPWLERTQWLPYLVGMERPDLLACIEEPVAEPDARQEQQAEPVEAAIWAAMDGLARFSQASIIDRIGVFIRLEAIRTEMHQTRFQPLQPYMDKNAIVKHTRPARVEEPKYRFTRRQREAWEVLIEQAKRSIEGDEEDEAEDMDEEREELDEEMMDDIDEAIEVAEEEPACLEFCIALLNHRITRREYDSPLVCALAVLGVKEDGWKGPEQYPPILSAVIKIARFMVVQKGLEMSGPEEDSGDETDDDLDDSAHSPMQWMLDLRTYGLKIHYNTTTRGHVEWTNGDELLYKELHFSMAQFRGMVHGLASESRRLLTEELMFSSKAAPVPAVPWESIRDNPTDERPGWNFLKDHRTNMPVNGERWLFERVGESASIRKRYMDRVVEFREKLAVLMHITGGQPARGPELLSVRHSNTVQGGHRNIFIEDGMVVFVTRYHKGYKVSGDVKIIHRYLPREVGELVVWYMWLVLPFQQRLEALVWEKEAVSSHMWPADPSGRKWTTDRLREALKRESRIAMGQEWTFAGYREMAIGISRRFCADEGEENKEWAEEQAGDSIADEQAGHTSHVAGLVYARGIMEQSGAVADRRQQFRASSTDWHRFWASRQAWTTREEAASGRERRLRARQTRQGWIGGSG